MRARHGLPHPARHDALLELGETWSPSRDAACLARYIFRIDQIEALSALPATVAGSEGEAPSLERSAAATGLALALAGVCHGAEIAHPGAAEAVRGKAWYAPNSAPEGITSSASTRRMQALLEHPEFSFDRLHTQPQRGWCGERELDGLVFEAAVAHGFQAEISTLRATSILLAAIATWLPLEDACDRLDIALEDLLELLPELDGDAEFERRPESAGAEAAADWSVRPVLDVWRGRGFAVDVPAPPLILPKQG